MFLCIAATYILSMYIRKKSNSVKNIIDVASVPEMNKVG